MPSIYVEYKVSQAIFNSITLFIKPNTKRGDILTSVDTETDPVGALCGGIIFSHMLNNLPKDGKAYENNTSFTGDSGNQKDTQAGK